MKFSSFLKKSLLGLAVVPVLLLASGNKAHAAQIPYVPGQPLPSISTPGFNVFTNLPNGTGNEADFVRIRPSTGDPANSGTNGERNALYISDLNAACATGDMFDVRTYMHNGADSDFNDNGNGTSVAHGVQLAMTAELGKNGTTFPFTSTITATNAATVTDDANLTCARNVRLEIVPGTIRAYSRAIGWFNWSDPATSPLNNQISVGSHEMNSGDLWGCWDEIVIVVYTVKVVDVPVTPPIAEYSCDLLTNTGKIAENKYGFKVDYTAKNGATLKDITYVYNDGATVTDGATTSHVFTNTSIATKKVTATANFTVNGEDKTSTSAKCATEFTVTTPVTPVTPTKPEVLPSTGAGSTIAIFTVTSFIGALLYRAKLLRNLL